MHILSLLTRVVIVIAAGILLISFGGCSKENQTEKDKNKDKSETITRSAQMVAQGEPGDLESGNLLNSNAQANNQENNQKQKPAGPPYLKVSAEVLAQPMVQTLMASADGKIQVIEFFNYGCYWCAQTDPGLQAWLRTKPDDVVFTRVPVVFHQSWLNLAKAYHTIETLGAQHSSDNIIKINTPEEINQMHADFFKLAQANPDIGNDVVAIQAFCVQQGIFRADKSDKSDQLENQAAFLEIFESFDFMDDYMISTAFGIRSIPTFIIQGKKGVYLTSAGMTGSQETLFPMIDKLIGAAKA